MTTAEILTRWAEYSNYDPNQTRFNLLSSNWYTHNASENAKKIFDYDPSGRIAVLYLKEMFRRLCKESSFNMMSVLEHPEGLTEHKQMWDIFHSEDVNNIENAILGAMDGIISQIVPVKQIGERDTDTERQVLAESVSGVVEELSKCNEELFLRGRPFGEIKSFSTEIHVFDTLAQCLLTLEAAPDSMYVCYIRNKDSADGYFGFYIKSNGNILSINERVPERYPGQHKVSRNGRWTDGKAYRIFPYKLMQDIGSRDYLGYAHHYTIDDSELRLFNLGPDAYMPLVLAMVMLSMKYSGTSTDELNLNYVDSLLPHNIALAARSNETALAIPQHSMIVEANKGYEVNFTSQQVLSGELNKSFTHSLLDKVGVPKAWRTKGTFGEGKNIFIELYGAGFQLDTDALLEKDRHLALPNSLSIVREDQTPNFEFIGDKDTMDLVAYRNARIQLAEYVRDEMFKEYVAFGGAAAVKKWFRDQIAAHKDDILRICAEAFAEAEGKNETMSKSLGWTICDQGATRSSGYRVGIDFAKSGVAAYGDGATHPFNKNYVYVGSSHTRKWGCALRPGVKATYEFSLVFTDWTQMAKLFGEENVPKIIKGYNQNGHDFAGNNLLDVVDHAAGIGTPFEEREYNRNPRYWNKKEWQDHYFRSRLSGLRGWNEKDAEIIPETALKEAPPRLFHVAVALSKQGINDLLRKEKLKPL